MNPSIAIDSDGEGTSLFTMPGVVWNGFGRSAGVADLRAAVDAYNADVRARSIPIPAGASTAVCTLVIDGQRRCPPRTPRNQVYPLITLGERFANGDTLMTTDVRLTRNIPLTEKVRLSLIGEAFNLFNIANLGGFSSSLQSTNFGIPTNRLNQVFGSGGPRAFQLAARLSF